jgi:proteasome lid subunit RPN8/RPN11
MSAPSPQEDQHVYRFAIEVYQQDPSKPLATLPAPVDLEPALEWARFTAARTLPDADWLLTADPEHGRIEPQWDSTSGRPHIEGIRAIIPCGDAEPASYEIPLSYFNPAVQAVAALLVLGGKLSVGECFQYRVLAHCGSCPAPDQPPAFSVTRAEPSLEIEDRSLDELLSRSAGPSAWTDVPVFIPRGVLTEIVLRARGAGAKETGGVLIGHLRRDRGRPDLFVEVTAQVPARLAEEELAKLTFTPETWSDVDEVTTARALQEIYLGWYHHHPAAQWRRSVGVPEPADTCGLAGGFLSPEDIALHRTVFPRAWSVALLLSDERRFALFGWRHGMIRRRRFHVVNDPPRPAETIEPEGESQYAS